MSFFARETETDAVSTSKQLVASEVPNKVHAILSKEVIKLFNDSHELPDDSLIQEKLIRPLEALWGASEVYNVLQSNPTVANFCGKVFKNGEPAIFCKDCQTDPTCCLCLECFDQSEHKNHNYKMFASGGGGCCDCGDPEAWNDHIYCTIHKPQEVEAHQVDPISHLQEPVVQCARSFLSTMMWYCMTVLNWEESRSVPPIVSSAETHTL